MPQESLEASNTDLLSKKSQHLTVGKSLSEAGNMAGKEPSHIPVKNRYAERFRMTFQNSGIK